jgi:hypothetical protein
MAVMLWQQSADRKAERELLSNSRSPVQRRNKMDSSTIRLVCAIIAAAFLAVIVARRRKRPE